MFTVAVADPVLRTCTIAPIFLFTSAVVSSASMETTSMYGRGTSITAKGTLGAVVVMLKSPQPEESVNVSSASSVWYSPFWSTHSTILFHSLPPMSIWPFESVKSSRVDEP